MTQAEWGEMLARVKAGGDDGWKPVWENVIVPETKSRRIAELMKKYSLTDGDLMGMLYQEMIGERKIELFRNDGGNLWGWMRAYVRGYVLHADPASHGEFSLEGTAAHDEGGEAMAIPQVDFGIVRNEAWDVTHRCLKMLWNDDPVKAYVHVLRTRFHRSSEEVCNMLGISSPAAVDQIFSRAVKDMRGYWVHYDKTGEMAK